jgi:hypothetical protein
MIFLLSPTTNNSFPEEQTASKPLPLHKDLALFVLVVKTLSPSSFFKKVL